MTEKAQQKEFVIQKIFTKDISFESPNAPAVFKEGGWNPKIDVQVQTGAKPLEEDKVFEVVLTVTVTAQQNEKTAFLVEVQQAGIFTVGGFEDAEKGHLFGSYCPNLLFPYAREVVSDLVAKGGFPALLLQPINFDALYAQHVQQRQAEAAPAQAH